jgi:spore germination cell wall hydrolase CwlJ-like protein
MYEVYPKMRDNWKTAEEVYNGVDQIEQRMEVTFHIDFYDPDTGKKTTYYDVDNLMPLLTRELDYTYIANNVVLA